MKENEGLVDGEEKKTSNVQVNWHRRLEGIRVDSRLNGNFAGNQIKVSQYSRCPGNDEGVQNAACCCLDFDMPARL